MEHSIRPQSVQVVVISAGPLDRLRLTDPYVEEVWSEFLGPTATLLARRLGRTVDEWPGGVRVDVKDLSASVGVAPGVVLRALERLHRFEVVHCDLERRVVGVSGYAPLVGDHRVNRLSERGRVAHERVTADLGAQPGVPGRAAMLLAHAPSIEVERELSRRHP